MSPKYAYVKTLTPNALGGGAFGWQLGFDPKGDALMTAIAVLVGVTRELAALLPALLHVSTQQAVSHPQHGTRPCDTLIPDWPGP